MTQQVRSTKGFRRRGALLATSALIALLAAAGIVVAVWSGGGRTLAAAPSQPGGDEGEIRSLVVDFVAAVESGDARRTASLLCRDEAAEYLDRLEPDLLDAEPTAPEDRSVVVQQVAVRGTVAEVTLVRPAQADVVRTLWASKEQGRWTICSDAGPRSG